MKHLRYVLIVFLVILLSGCSIDYTLIIDDHYFDEYISVVTKNSKENQYDINNDYNPIHYSDEIKYEKSIKRKKNDVTIGLHYRYSKDDFINANSLNQIFYNRIIEIDDNRVYLNLKDSKGLNVNTDFDIKIKTRNKVLKNNADEIKNNTYIWHVKKDNLSNINIEIEIQRKTIKNNQSLSRYIYFVIISIGILFLFLIVYFVMRKIRSNNDI